MQTAIATSLNFPAGVAVDAVGSVYFSSFDDGAVYLLTLSSGIYSAPATAVTGLNQPRKIALDGNGDIFIADTGNSRVVEEVPDGEGYSQTVVGSGMQYPYGVAVGAGGSVYVADTGNDSILLETPSGEGFTQSVLIPGPTAPGIALDGLGNVYFPDVDAIVFKIDFADPPSFSFSSTIIGATSSDSPQTVTILNVGNAALLLPPPGSGSNPAVPAGFELGAATTCPEVPASGSAGSLAANASCVYVIDFEPTAIESYSGSLVLSDNSLNVNSATQSISLSGTGLPLPATQLAVSGVPVQILAGGNLGTATVDVENADSAIVTGSSATVTVTVTGPGGYSQMVSGAAVSGVYSANLSSLILTVAGTYTVTATSTGLASAAANSIVDPVEVNLPTSPVGTPSSTITVTIPFATATGLGTPAVQVVTQGAAHGLDFSNVGTGTCTDGAAIAAGSSCTVDVVFTPKYPGIRYGAAILDDESGNVLTTIYLSGTGTGPMVNFLPGTGLPVAEPEPPYNLQAPASSQVDASGNIYVVDHNANKLYKKTPSEEGYVQSVIPTTGLNLPEDAAIDGAGNIYIVDSANNRVIKLTYTGGSWVQSTILSMNYPAGIAVDAQGNLYVSTEEDGFLYLETLSNGSYTQTTIATGLSQPRKVAVDASGNVYVADSENARVLKETPTGEGYTQTVVGSGMTLPFGVAVDINGNVYVSDAETGAIYTETPLGEGYTQSSFPGGISPISITVDQQGNLYESDRSFGTVAKLDRYDPPFLDFNLTAVGATSSDSPRTVTVADAGNTALSISVPGSGSNPAASTGYSLAGSTSCPRIASSGSAGAISVNTSCTYAVNFSPTVPGDVSGTLALTDNSLNVTASTQTVELNGSAYIPLGHYAITGLPTTSVAGVSVPFTLTAESAAGAVITISYAGTAHLTSSDAQAVFSLTSGGSPITSYTFQSSDAGVKVLYVTFKTAGSQTAAAIDTVAEVTVTSASDLVTAAAAATRQLS